MAGNVTVTVQAASLWQGSGVNVVSGQLVTISATGTWSIWAPGTHSANGPDGSDDAIWPLSLVPDARQAALIGRIGSSGAPFLVGSYKQFTATSSGEIQFISNDNYNEGLYGDNWGSLQVTVSTQDVEVSYTVSPATIDFGSVFFREGISKSFDVNNTGGSNLSISSISVSAPGSLYGLNISPTIFNVPPGSCMVAKNIKRKIAH